MKVNFKSKELLDADVIDSPITETIVEHSRWAVVYEIVFEYEGEFWRTLYSRAATENQDEIPWQYKKEVECTKVELKEVTRKQWVEVD